MKMKINKACDLASICALPPRRPRGSGGGGTSASASAAASQQPFSQGVGSGGGPFSQGRVGRGGEAFSQGRVGRGGEAFSQIGAGGATSSQVGAGGAPLSQSQPAGSGGAPFSQSSQGGGSGGAPLSQSQPAINQISLDENLLGLLRPSPARAQRFTLHDDSSKRMSSVPANAAPSVHEEPQLQLSKIPTNPIHRWNSSRPDTRCQVNEDVERKFQHVASSVHKMGMVLDSVQNDVMQLNRAMKEASLDSGSMQKKFVLVENTLQQILKGQDDLKALLLGSTKSNPDQMSVLNSHTGKLDEISSTLSVLKQVQEELKHLKAEIFGIFTKEMEGVVRAIRLLNTRPDAIQMLADESCTNNTKLLMNQRPVADGRPKMNQTAVANGRPQKKQNPVPNGKSQMRQAPVANGQAQLPQMNQVAEANGNPLMKQKAATKEKVQDVEPRVEEGKAQKMVASSCCRVAPIQEEVGVENVNPHAPTKKAPFSIIIDWDGEEGSDGGSSSTKPGAGAAGELTNGEEVSQDALEILQRARKRRRREASCREWLKFDM